MQFEDEIYFSKNFEWKSVDINDGIDLANKYNDRIRTLYMDQANLLLSKDEFYNSFTAGIILFAVIDCLGTFLTTKKGFKNKLDEFLKESEEFNKLNKVDGIVISKMITKCFRNGIIHNSRVKESCQFDYNFDNKLFVLHEDILIINTKHLFELVSVVLNSYIDRVITNEVEMSVFKKTFAIEFESEIKRLTV